MLFILFCALASARQEWSVSSITLVDSTESTFDITIETPDQWIHNVHRHMDGPRWLHVSFGLQYAWNASIPTGYTNFVCSSLYKEIESILPFHTRIQSQWDQFVPEENGTSVTLRIDAEQVSSNCRLHVPSRNESTFQSVGSRFSIYRREFWFPVSLVLWGADAGGRPDVVIERHSWFLSFSIPIEHQQQCFLAAAAHIDTESDKRIDSPFYRPWSSSVCGVETHTLHPSSVRIDTMDTNNHCHKRKVTRTSVLGRGQPTWDVSRCRLIHDESRKSIPVDTEGQKWIHVLAEDTSILEVCGMVANTSLFRFIDVTNTEDPTRIIANAFKSPRSIEIEVRCPIVSVVPATKAWHRKLLSDDEDHTRVFIPGTIMSHDHMVSVSFEITDHAECSWSSVRDEIVCVDDRTEEEHSRRRGLSTKVGSVIIVSMVIFIFLAITCVVCIDNDDSEKDKKKPKKSSF